MESRESVFILHDIWPLLKVFQVLGLFPCKKVIDDEGNIQLKPMKTWFSIMLFSIWSMVFFVPPIGMNLYFENKTGIINKTKIAFEKVVNANYIRF